MSTDHTTTATRYTLNCGHVIDAPAGKKLGSQLRCSMCSHDAGKAVRPRIKAVVNPTGDSTVDAALDGLAADLMNRDVAAKIAAEVKANPDGVTASVVKAVVAKAEPWCLRFRNMSPARRDAVAFAGWPCPDGPLIICDQTAAASFVGLLRGSLNRLSTLPQPTAKQRSTIERMLQVADRQRAAAPARGQA